MKPFWFARSNDYAAPGGMRAEELVGCLEAALALTDPAALTVASFDPECSGDDRIAKAGVAAIVAVTARLSPGDNLPRR